MSNGHRWGHLLEPARGVFLKFPVAPHTGPSTPSWDLGRDRCHCGPAPRAGSVHRRLHEVEAIWMGGEKGAEPPSLILADGEPDVLPNNGVVPFFGNHFLTDCASVRHATKTTEEPQNHCGAIGAIWAKQYERLKRPGPQSVDLFTAQQYSSLFLIMQASGLSEALLQSSTSPANTRDGMPAMSV